MSSNSFVLLRATHFLDCSVVLKYYPSNMEYIISYSDHLDYHNNFFFLEFSNALQAYSHLCTCIEQDLFVPATDLESYNSLLSFLKFN